MSVTAEKKQEIIQGNARDKNDTGSPEVQVAILTERIRNLTQDSASRLFVFDYNCAGECALISDAVTRCPRTMPGRTGSSIAA